jgi:signal transduction histidine kinase
VKGRPLGLAARLFLAQVPVLVVGALTAAVVATLVGPPLFRRRLELAGPMSGDAATRHVHEAYTSANVISLTVALIAALAAAMVVSGFVARRVARPVVELAAAAAHVASGHRTVQVSAPPLGGEFHTLAAAFNQMATRLDAVEATRRRMLADLAHEMRTPLATIEAYLEAAEDGIAVPDEDHLRVLRDQTARLRRLAADIAAVSRAEEQPDLHVRAVAPAELIDAAVAAAAGGYAGKGVALAAKADPGLPNVLADPERIGQVLANLLDNALRHTPLGGQVTISAATSAATRGSAVDIVVADTGDGVSVQHLPHLFERFYRADPARDRKHGGSGIGLAVVRAVVAAHNGHVSADSPGPGYGATFTISLPTNRRA